MSRMTDDEIGELLKQGLRKVPVPDASAGFDSQVRARLRRPQPRWQLFWSAVRLTLAPAAFSLAVTLAGLIAMGTPKPEGAPRPQAPAVGNLALDRGPDRLLSIDRDLDRIDIETPSLGGFGIRRADPAERAPQPQPRGRRGASDRRETSASMRG